MTEAQSSSREKEDTGRSTDSLITYVNGEPIAVDAPMMGLPDTQPEPSR